MTDTLQAALYSIPADDRETWVQIGMAIKSELGDAGFDLWNIWSRQSDRYEAMDARVVWRSIKTNGGITIRTLYHEAKTHGWKGEAPARPQVNLDEKRRRAEDQAREDAEAERMHREAASFAEKVIAESVFSAHPYLANKGFPEGQGLVTQRDYYRNGQDVPLVERGSLILPMRDAKTGALCSLQEIKADGTKKNLAGGRAKGAVHRLGRGFARCYCEGYTTGLSIQAALAQLYRRDEVVVCFSAQALPQAASYDWWPDGYVVADHDLHSCPRCKHRWDGAWESCCPVCGNTKVTMPAGERYAKQTGLPYWMPPEPGDANDFHQRHGVEALADALRGVLKWTGRVETLSI